MVQVINFISLLIERLHQDFRTFARAAVAKYLESKIQEKLKGKWLLHLEAKEQRREAWVRVKAELRELPNRLTLLRILAVPFIAWLIWFHLHRYAVGAVVILWVTDMFDGELARQTENSDGIGKWLDPLADKVLFLGILLTSQHVNAILWQPLFIASLALEFVLLFAFAWRKLFARYDRTLTVQANDWGKRKLFAQSIGSTLMLLAPELGAVQLAINGIIALATVLAVMSIFGHLKTAMR